MDSLHIGGLDYSPSGIYVVKTNVVMTDAVAANIRKFLGNSIREKHEGAVVIVLDSNFDVVSVANDEIMEGLGWVKKEDEAIK